MCGRLGGRVGGLEHAQHWWANDGRQHARAFGLRPARRPRRWIGARTALVGQRRSPACPRLWPAAAPGTGGLSMPALRRRPHRSRPTLDYARPATTARYRRPEHAGAPPPAPPFPTDVGLCSSRHYRPVAPERRSAPSTQLGPVVDCAGWWQVRGATAIWRRNGVRHHRPSWARSWTVLDGGRCVAPRRSGAGCCDGCVQGVIRRVAGARSAAVRGPLTSRCRAVVMGACRA